MQVVIDIPDEEYINIKKAINSLIEIDVDFSEMSQYCLAIVNGKPLPKGHGDLVDRNDLYNWLSNADTIDVFYALDEGMDIKELPAIIAADD